MFHNGRDDASPIQTREVVPFAMVYEHNHSPTVRVGLSGPERAIRFAKNQV
jgi:hypothetical protein